MEDFDDRTHRQRQEALLARIAEILDQIRTDVTAPPESTAYGDGATISSGKVPSGTMPPGTHVWGLGTPEEGWKARAVAAEAEMQRLLHENRRLRDRISAIARYCQEKGGGE